MLKSKSIDVKSLQLGNIDSWADFVWHYSPERIMNAFAKVGIAVDDESDITELVNLHKRGGDVNGELKDKNNNPIVFNVLKVMQSIDVDKAELKRKFIPTKDFQFLKRTVLANIAGNDNQLRGHVSVLKVGEGVKITCLNNGVVTVFNYPSDGNIDAGTAFVNSCKNQGGTITYQKIGLYSKK